MSHPATPNFAVIQCSDGTIRLATTYTTDSGTVKELKIGVSADETDILSTARLNADGLAKFQSLLTIAVEIKKLGQVD